MYANRKALFLPLSLQCHHYWSLRVCLRVEARGHQGRKLIVLHRMGGGGRHPGRSGLRLWLLRLTSAVFACLNSLHPFHRRRQGLGSRDEGMPERLAGRDAMRRVVVQHAQDQVHKDLVVGDLVTRIDPSSLAHKKQGNPSTKPQRRSHFTMANLT